MHRSVKACLDHAVHDGLIPRNPAYKANIYGTRPEKPEEDKYMEIEEYSRLKQYVKQRDSKSALVVFILIATGARFSE